MRWADFALTQYPELELLYHIPNEGKRSKVTGGRLKALGLKSGVPDLFVCRQLTADTSDCTSR